MPEKENKSASGNEIYNFVSNNENKVTCVHLNLFCIFNILICCYGRVTVNNVWNISGAAIITALEMMVGLEDLDTIPLIDVCEGLAHAAIQ